MTDLSKRERELALAISACNISGFICTRDRNHHQVVSPGSIHTLLPSNLEVLEGIFELFFMHRKFKYFI